MTWNLLIDNYPPPCKYVLVKRVACYGHIPIEILTAHYNPEYPKSPWRDVSNTPLVESGEDPFSWKECKELEDRVG